MASAMAERTVLAALPRAILATLAELGHDADALRERAGIELSALADPDGRIPLSRHLALWDHVAAVGPTIGLDLGSRLGLRALGVIGFVLEHRETLAEALADLERFRRVVLEDAVPRLVTRRGERGDEAVLVQTVPPRISRLARPVETQAAASTVALRTLAGSAFSLRAVRFPHPPPRDTQPYRAVFGVVPTFGASCTELVFDAAWLSRANHRRNPALAAYLATRAGELAKGLVDAPLEDRVRRALTESLASSPAPSDVARALGTSTRTLQRRLEEAGTSFALLLDETRRERALVLVADRSRTAGEIAFALGFREAPTFFRAFKRWTGTTPKMHRAALPP